MSISLENRLRQEEQRKKQRKVYSTEIINVLMKEYQQGYNIPYDAFFNRDIDLRNANVTFKMTPQEMEEYQKCYDDPIYYVRNYCKFMTDKGRTLVQLFDYQEKMIKLATDEVYIPELDEFGPKNRNIIWTSARQSGKCSLFGTLLDNKTSLTGCIKNNIGQIYNKYCTKKTFLQRVKSFLYKIYSLL